MDSYSHYYNSSSKNHPEIETGDLDVDAEEHKQLQSQDEEELLSLPDGLWDYLMMDEHDQEEQERDSPTLAEIILGNGDGSDTPTSTGEEILRPKTNPDILEEKLLSLVENEVAEAIVTLSSTHPTASTATAATSVVNIINNNKTTICQDKAKRVRSSQKTEQEGSNSITRDAKDNSTSSSSSCSPFDLVNDIQNATKDDLDAILAKQMNKLSMNERERYNHEIVHGTQKAAAATQLPAEGGSSIEEETPEFIQMKLDEFEIYLNSSTSEILTNISKESYEHAKYISPEYVYDRNFRLMFLRGELFDVEKAALRFLKHFTIKEELFGSALLAKHITLSDLTSNDIQNLQLGIEQILPVRDTNADRLVICIMPTTTANAKTTTKGNHQNYGRRDNANDAYTCISRVRYSLFSKCLVVDTVSLLTSA